MELHHIAVREGKLLPFLRQELHLSSTLVKRLKFRNGLLVNGEPVHTDFFVHCGDRITVCLDEPTPDFPAEHAPITVLYEDECFIALDKPAGLLMHPSFNRNTGTLANQLLGYYERTGQACAVHPVNRLDRDTFGVVLLAKNAHVNAVACQMLKEKGFQKTYHAAVFGVPSPPCGCVEAPIARYPAPSILRYIHPDGQPARTDYQTMHTYNGCSFLQLQPVTGRTHQLRLHCAHLGCPILGDPQYGSEASQALSVRLGLAHQQLCAVQLAFVHPFTGEKIEIFSQQEIYFPKK